MENVLVLSSKYEVSPLCVFTSEVVVVKSHHGISVKWSRYWAYRPIPSMQYGWWKQDRWSSYLKFVWRENRGLLFYIIQKGAYVLEMACWLRNVKNQRVCSHPKKLGNGCPFFRYINFFNPSIPVSKKFSPKSTPSISFYSYLSLFHLVSRRWQRKQTGIQTNQLLWYFSGFSHPLKGTTCVCLFSCNGRR